MGSTGPTPSRGATERYAHHISARWRAVARTVLAVGVLAFGFPASEAPADPGPAPVIRFEAVSDGATVELRWAAVPGRAVGFHILRASREAGPYAPVNAWLIAAVPDGKYRFVDLAVDPGATYRYKVESVDPQGAKTALGPLTIPVMPEEAQVLVSEGQAPSGAGHEAGDVLFPDRPMAVGGCAAHPAARWRDAAGIPLLLGAALLWGLGRGRRRA